MSGKTNGASPTRPSSINALSPGQLWSQPAATLLTALRSSPDGLTGDEARIRLTRTGANSLETGQHARWPALLLSQFKSPIVLILLFATIVSAILQDWVDAAIILAIVGGSAALSFVQEYSAGNAAEKLRSQIRIKTTVLRDGAPSSCLRKRSCRGTSSCFRPAA